jgi:hypothetical protein
MRLGIITSTVSFLAIGFEERGTLTKAHCTQTDEDDSESDKERASGASNSVAEPLQCLEAFEYNAGTHHGGKKARARGGMHVTVHTFL